MAKVVKKTTKKVIKNDSSKKVKGKGTALSSQKVSVLKKKVEKSSLPKKEVSAVIIPPKIMTRLRAAAKGKKQIPYEFLIDVMELEDRPEVMTPVLDQLVKEGLSVGEPDMDTSYTPETVAADVLDDPLQIYLRDIGRVPLLAEEEEFRIAKIMYESNEKIARIEREIGVSVKDYKALLKTRSPEREEKLGKLTPTQKRLFSAIIKEAEKDIRESQRLLIESNLRLVVSIAKKYSNRGLPLLDIINEGNLGLIRAVEKFDYRKGFKFSTYATWWIRQSIRRALADQGRTIRVPVHMSEMINRWIKVTRYLSQKFGREPSIAETAQEMSTSEAKILEIIKIAQEPSFLEDPVGPSGGSVFADIIADEESISPVRAVMAVMFSDHIQKVLATLKDKERQILELRFGLGNQKEHTLEEVGKILGITRERVRQVEARALEKLRHMRLTQEILSLVGEH